jgi:hypothetical protein
VVSTGTEERTPSRAVCSALTTPASPTKNIAIALADEYTEYVDAVIKCVR